MKIYDYKGRKNLCGDRVREARPPEYHASGPCRASASSGGYHGAGQRFKNRNRNAVRYRLRTCRAFKRAGGFSGMADNVRIIRIYTCVSMN